MSKYIEIDTALLKTVATGGISAKALWKRIVQQPSIDIVHCKDCKHSEYREDFDNYLCDQLGLGSVNDADFFCSYGERKDNEQVHKVRGRNP